jgi:hypothetical protein
VKSDNEEPIVTVYALKILRSSPAVQEETNGKELELEQASTIEQAPTKDAPNS